MTVHSFFHTHSTEIVELIQLLVSQKTRVGFTQLFFWVDAVLVIKKSEFFLHLNCVTVLCFLSWKCLLLLHFLASCLRCTLASTIRHFLLLWQQSQGWITSSTRPRSSTSIQTNTKKHSYYLEEYSRPEAAKTRWDFLTWIKKTWSISHPGTRENI